MTRAGWVVAVLGAVMVIAGFDAGIAVPVVVGSSAVMLAAATWLISRIPVTVSGELVLEHSQVTVGDVSIARLLVRNDHRRPSPPAWGRLEVLDEVVPLAIPALEPGADQQIELPLPTRQRASGSVGPVFLTSVDPFRLSSHSVQIGDASEFFVWPQRLPVGWAERGLPRPMEGTVSGGLQSDPLSFVGLRNYELGDDVRLVHWPTVARTGELVVRRTLDTSPRRLDVFLDARDDHWDPARFEQGVAIAASLLESADLAGVNWGLLWGSERFPVTGRSSRDLGRALDALSGVEPQPTVAGLDLSLVYDASVVVISGRADPTDHEVLAVLAGRVTSVMLVEVIDAFARSYAPLSSAVDVVRVASLEQFAEVSAR